MSYRYPYRQNVSITFGGPLTRGVKYIIVSTLVLFTLQLLIGSQFFVEWFGLYPPSVIPGLQIWRLATYLFVHGGLGHVLINMLFLFMFGCRLEREWGTHTFVQYYFVCGIGAGLFTFIPIQNFYGANHIGASGAIFGVLLAYGVLYPRNIIYFMLTIPLEVRYFVIIMGLIALYGTIGAGGSGISHIAHLGGLAVGYVYLRLGGVGRRRTIQSGSVGISDSIKQVYHRWRMKRLKKKFERYYEERTGGEDSKYKYH